MQDDERTPINRFGVSPATSTGNLISVNRYPQEDIAGAAGKYECEYCGKGFTRPSSLKVHAPHLHLVENYLKDLNRYI